MTKEETKLQNFLKMLGDGSKFRIVLHLTKGEECVCVIAEKLGLEQTLVSHHLNTLRDANLIQDRKVGTWVHCSINKKTFKEMEGLYQKLLSSENISDRPCDSHDICRKLFAKKL